VRDPGDAAAGRGGAGLPVASGRRYQMKVRIDYAICNSCGLCREVCPESAIRPTLLEPRHLYEVQEAKCTGCGECLEYCPAPGALVQYEA
jgi:NAD-dependent dihydropyrimidine dehydrogenase PreA subunit